MSATYNIDELTALINVIPNAVFIKSRDHKIVLLNDTACELFGHARAVILSMSDHDLFPADQVASFHEADNRVFETGVDDISEEQVTDAQGRVRTVVTRKRPILLDGQPHLVAVTTDVSSLREAEAANLRLALHDSLTGLPNRSYFNRRFEAEVRRAADLGLNIGAIMVDLDHFKDINDTLGHDAGDAVLKVVSDRLKRAYRETDFIARLGGDEFAIILPGITDLEAMRRPTEALLAMLATPLDGDAPDITITASLGGALFSPGEGDASELLKNADLALYDAKANGRNRFVGYRPSMRDAASERVEILREIRRGVSAGEFCLHYQPVVGLHPQAVTGFEALMRWRHPARGVLSPPAFSAGFEDPGLALQLCDLTFDHALKQMRAWIEQGVEFGRVAVNVSALQFRSADLAQRVEAKLRHWGVPADRLTIEVTENVYMGWGADAVGDTVRRLHAAGVLIALDDFGTGYASLSNLKQFPIDRLKIDKSFVQNAADQAIVRAVITLGSSLGMKVIAEGVEEAEQLRLLEELGCDQVQGYHFARPMPATDVPTFLREFHAGRNARPKVA